jgi:integrase
MQRGTIRQHHGSWTLFYYDDVLVEGKRVRKYISKKLVAVGDDYPTKRSVLLLAEKILAPLNAGTQVAESTMTVLDFIDNVYLPHVKKELRPSTYKDYNDIVRVHLRQRLGDVRLRDFRTVHGQRLMREITGVGHVTLLRVKSLLSGVFKHAKREGFLDGENPIRDVSVPGRPKKFRGPTYELYEIEDILAAISKHKKAFAVVSTAAFTGLRMSELRGLRWMDYSGELLHVRRSVWRTTVNETKTAASEASVPVLPVLRKVLDEHRTRVNGHGEQYIFAGERRGTPLNLANLVRRTILPALAEYSDEVQQSVKWKGWHAFRRSLATLLRSCGVDARLTMEILRHSDIATTMNIYTMVSSEDARRALQKIEDLLANEEGTKLEMSEPT